MKFFRAELRDLLTKALVYRAVAGLVFSDGTVSGTEPLPAAYNDRSTFEVPLTGNGAVQVLISVQALGAGGLTGITFVIEFYDPDTARWYPSKEGVARTADLATHQWACNAVGDFILASRVEHNQFKAARVRFKASAGAADAATVIKCSYTGNSSAVPDWAKA